jgi:hypothetical protein
MFLALKGKYKFVLLKQVGTVRTIKTKRRVEPERKFRGPEYFC